MNRQFYSLPEPGELGLEWQAYEEGRERIARMDGRRQEVAQAARDLEQRIREEKRTDVRKLAQSILAGAEDPAASTEALEGFAGELREQRRSKEALDQAHPQAEEGLRQTIFENQAVWKSQVDRVLLKAIEEERKAYERARQIAQKARSRRQYAEALANWIRNPSPSFGAPSDVTIAATVQQTWADDLERCERQMHERQQNERLLAETTEGGAA
jgi:hypothetical protein